MYIITYFQYLTALCWFRGKAHLARNCHHSVIRRKRKVLSFWAVENKNLSRGDDQALEVVSFGNAENDGMVFGLSTNLQQAQSAPGVGGGRGQHLTKIFFAHVIRTGTGDQHSCGTQHFHRAQVQFFIPAQRGFQVPLAFSKRRGIKNNRVILLPRGGIVFQKVEGVGFNPLNLGTPASPVEFFIFFGDFQRRARAVERCDRGTGARKVKGKASLVAENIQRCAMRITFSGGVVFPLVEESAALLSAQRVVMKADSIQLILRRGLLAP